MAKAKPALDQKPKTGADLFAQPEAIRARVSARNRDLTEQEIDEFADALVKEEIDSLAEKGQIVFERDRDSR